MIILDPISVSDPGVFVSSNVPENDYPAQSLTATYAAGARVIDAAAHLIYESKTDGNLGKPLSDGTYWLPKGATNRWKMLDAYNNTQTENAESIVLTLKPQAIAQGIYLGNLDAAEVVITSTDPAAGVVYQQTSSLLVSSSSSSLYRWLFNRLRRKTSFLSLDLPLYYAATVTIAINNPGGIAKCGMCSIGPTEEIGGSEYGLSRDLKDYSTTRFNFDGTSETTERGFSKRMSVDLILDNDRIDYIQERMEGLRQKSIVYIGASMYGMTILCGKFSSLKNVIAGVTYSKMALQIEGNV